MTAMFHCHCCNESFKGNCNWMAHINSDDHLDKYDKFVARLLIECRKCFRYKPPINFQKPSAGGWFKLCDQCRFNYRSGKWRKNKNSKSK